MSPSDLTGIRSRLLRWYRQNLRDLPWRRTSDPYAIWIAETMLQQTQVKTVLPYYRRFLKALPTIQALDRASLQRVLTLWSGLGYYRRAENLKKAARKIVREHHGRLPRERHDLLALPGVGSYTAGALLSIAFNRPFPAVDGNARRVLTRVFNVKGDKKLASLAHELAHCASPGRLNQALMELGATICLPRLPRCAKCPFVKFCDAYGSGQAQIGRQAVSKQTIRKVDWPLLVIQSGSRILLHRRASNGILAGLWEVPGGEKKQGETAQETLVRHLDGLSNRVTSISLIGQVGHSITNRRIRAPIFRGRLDGRTALPRSSWRWVSCSNLHRHPLSSLSRKAIKLAGE